MKILTWIVGFVAALAAFTASLLSIVDYAINKPEVVNATIRPVLAVYTAIKTPLVQLVALPDTSSLQNFWIDVGVNALSSMIVAVMLATFQSLYRRRNTTD